MIGSTVKGIKLTGIASAVPTKQVNNIDYASIFGEEVVKKTIDSTGVKTTYHSIDKQIASDLSYVAAKELLDKKNVASSEIGILLFISSHHDYIAPATSFVLQKRLGISTDSIVFDINLGCSACVYGLQVASSLLKTTDVKKALILIGDSSSRVVSPKDTSRLLFGDSGAALLIEKTEDEKDKISFGFKSDGYRFDDIYIPAGGFRHLKGSFELFAEEDGWERSDYHSHMKGTNVFAFSVADVPKLVREFMEKENLNVDMIDKLFMHQPNLYIIKNVIRKLKFPEDKVPVTIDKYGNTSGVSIPITMCDCYGNIEDGKKNLLLLGFGVGLSWGVSNLLVDTKDVFPVIHSDDYFDDGFVVH